MTINAMKLAITIISIITIKIPPTMPPALDDLETFTFIFETGVAIAVTLSVIVAEIKAVSVTSDLTDTILVGLGVLC